MDQSPFFLLGLPTVLGNSGVLRRNSNIVRFPAEFVSEMCGGRGTWKRQQSAPVPLDGALDSNIPWMQNEE